MWTVDTAPKPKRAASGLAIGENGFAVARKVQWTSATSGSGQRKNILNSIPASEVQIVAIPCLTSARHKSKLESYQIETGTLPWNATTFLPTNNSSFESKPVVLTRRWTNWKRIWKWLASFSASKICPNLSCLK